MKNSLDWIKSGGGPLVCIERGNAAQWLGVGGTNFGNGIHTKFSSDYERACDVQDYLGVIPLNTGFAVVLGDMPLETRVSYGTGDVPFIVRIFYADQGVDVVEKLNDLTILDEIDPVESVNVEIREREIVIFDSAYSFSEVGDAYLSLDFQPGKYIVVSKLFEPDERSSLLIHEFRRYQT
jgi:hypothetical protein